jgi:hypothetical protein
MRINYLILFLMLAIPVWGQQDGLFRIGRVKYAGGGDWYNGPTEEVNLLNYVKAHTNVKVKAEYKFVDIASDEIFAYPFLFLTGHGNIVFTEDEIVRLRKYLEGGGFLYIDDDYGLDKFIRREMKRVYPDKDFVELPFSHKLYHIVYDFPAGPPKTHEHDGKPPQGFGIFIDKRLAVYYTYESNPSDGWDDPEVHGDPPDKREEALRFGTNLVIYALSN